MNRDDVEARLNGTDLLGQPVRHRLNQGILGTRFLLPPFSILSAREGEWQKRKRAWINLGIQSELGRGGNLLSISDSCEEYRQRAGDYAARPEDGILPTASLKGGLTFGLTQAPYADPEVIKKKRRDKAAAEDAALIPGAAGPVHGHDRTEGPSQPGLTNHLTANAYRSRGKVAAASDCGTSIFDPVLTELMYSWFSPEGGQVIDPFAGGSVRGIVAAVLGRKYWGNDLSERQVLANRLQGESILGAGQNTCVWNQGDSRDEMCKAPEADFLFSCHPAGTKIVMSGGKLEGVENVKVGDFVVSHTGRVRQVTDTFARSYSGYIHHFYRDYRNLPLKTTSEHPLYVFRPTVLETRAAKPEIRQGERSWIRAEQVRVGDCLLEPVPIPRSWNVDGGIIWTYKPPPVPSHGRTGAPRKGNSTVRATQELGLLVGYYLSEGWSYDRAVYFTFHEKEIEYQRDVLRIFRSVFGADLKTTVHGNAPNNKSVVITCSGVKPSQFFRQNCGSGANTKRVPDWVFDSSEEIIKQVVIGCWRGDGWCSENSGPGYATVSEQLAEDLRRLLLRLGIVSSIRKRPKRLTAYCTKGEVNHQWYLIVRGGGAKKLADMLGKSCYTPKLRRPGRGPWIQDGYVHYPIRKITKEKVFKLPVFNMEVDEDHSYVADGVCSHNCPPYADLEVYSKDPADISNMDYPDFLDAYKDVIYTTCEKLRPDRFAAWVIGDVRDGKTGLYRDLPGDTVRAFRRAGLELYNTFILVTAVGSLSIRVTRQFEKSRKCGTTHQVVQVFLKGDPRVAAQACGGTG